MTQIGADFFWESELRSPGDGGQTRDGVVSVCWRKWRRESGAKRPQTVEKLGANHDVAILLQVQQRLGRPGAGKRWAGGLRCTRLRMVGRGSAKPFVSQRIAASPLHTRTAPQSVALPWKKQRTEFNSSAVPGRRNFVAGATKLGRGGRRGC